MMDDMAREYGAAIVRGYVCTGYCTYACSDCVDWVFSCDDCPQHGHCNGPYPLDGIEEVDYIPCCDRCAAPLDVILTPDGAQDLFNSMRKRAIFFRAQRDFQQARWAAAAARWVMAMYG